MWIKFELTGELEKQFLNICDEECRTSKQQAFYVLKEYIKKHGSEFVGTNENQTEQTGTNGNVLELDRTDKNKIDDTVPAEELDKTILSNILAF